ncbi:MAG: tetratricopeptide repeat protein [Candidatus Omnitrophica bacterium]|nr:tetratricopeptide repeat protein [Candidatus Omnitrophota bacterium]MBU1922871.1 tetratricopeptide repeat protein [Candidatus Omnitrophota bacterium]
MNKVFVVILSFICLVIYAGYLDNGFVFDDKILVEENPLIKSAHLLPNIFRTGIYDYWAGMQPYDRMYRPMQMLSYYLDYNLWGLNPAGFRFSNILLHLFNSILVFYLLILVFNYKLLAAASSILFLAHPVHISTVAYISARGDLLSAFFILACCVLFLKFLGSKNYAFYFLSIFAAALAFLSRENALLIIFFLTLIILFLVKNGARFKYLSGFFVLSLVYLAVRFIIFGPSGLAAHTDYIKGALLLFNFFNIICHYILLLLWPVNLRMFNSTVFISQLSIPALLLSIVGLILILAVILKCQKIKQPSAVLSFGLFWFLLGIIPVYFYFDAYPALGRALMAESWLYLPSIGFCAGFAYLCLLNKRGKLIIVACVAILGSLVAVNRGYWRNDVTFYERALQFLPQDSIILRNLTTAYIESGDFPKAYEAIKELEKYYADTPVINLAWGQYYFARGQAKEALSYYQRILSKSFSSNYSISLCYAKLGDLDKAIAFSRVSFTQNPFFQKNIIQLARLYNKTGQLEQANKYLLLAKQLDPKGRYVLLK